MMRKRILVLTPSVLAVIVFAFTSLAQGVEGNGKKNKITWQTFDKGVELAKKEKKMMVLDIYADWCHWCKVMDKDTYGNPEVVKYAQESLVMAKLNAETDEKFKFKEGNYSGRQLSMMFGVEGFPSTIFLNSEGELITTVSGFIPADRFILMLKYLEGNWYEKMKFDEFVKREQQRNKS